MLGVPLELCIRRERASSMPTKEALGVLPVGVGNTFMSLGKWVGERFKMEGDMEARLDARGVGAPSFPEFPSPGTTTGSIGGHSPPGSAIPKYTLTPEIKKVQK
eukprot:Hpha_TRINITY_DN16793_c1_g2::TRINITY_DN16793_c1_g2_i1::g.76334::m.76334